MPTKAGRVVLLAKMTGWWKRGASLARVSSLPASSPGADACIDAQPEPASLDWAGSLLRMARIDAAVSLSPEESVPVIAAARRALKRFADDPRRLPRRPQLLPQLLSTLNDADASSRDIAAIIARDPTLAAHLLKLANSALYRRHEAAVESLDRAVAMVGVDGLRHLVAVALMQPVMRVEGGALGRLPDLIWDHTQRTSLIAAQAVRSGGREDVFAAQLLGLLQGLGAIVVVQVLRDTCSSASSGVPDVDAVSRLLQRWSPRIGQAVAREWDLSARLSQALDEQGAEDVAAMGPLARALAFAAPEASDAMAMSPVADAA